MPAKKDEKQGKKYRDAAAASVGAGVCRHGCLSVRVFVGAGVSAGIRAAPRSVVVLVLFVVLAFGRLLSLAFLFGRRIGLFRLVVKNVIAAGEEKVDEFTAPFLVQPQDKAVFPRIYRNATALPVEYNLVERRDGIFAFEERERSDQLCFGYGIARVVEDKQ